MVALRIRKTTMRPCPSCKGEGMVQPEDKRCKPKVCLACKKEGWVEDYRVCATCGKWLSACACVRHPNEAVVKRSKSRC